MNILIFQDELSKFLVPCSMQKQDAEMIAREFVTHIILKMGTPKTVLTGQGTNFMSEIFKNVCRMLKIKKLQTTPFHPESNGSLEHSHRLLKECLRHYIRDDESNWDERIPYAVYVYNTSTHVATRYTPFELVHGFKSELPSNLRRDPSPQYNYDDFLVELKSRLQTAQQTTRERLITATYKSKEYYKRAEELQIEVGDKVLLYDENVQRGRSKKFCSQWLGPYEVISKKGANATIKKGKRIQNVHLNRLKLSISLGRCSVCMRGSKPYGLFGYWESRKLQHQLKN
jgi:hypothetical protein